MVIDAGLISTFPCRASIATLAAATLLLLACRRGSEETVIISPDRLRAAVPPIPSEPFGAPSPAYAQLRDVTDAALALSWNGRLESFAEWLEEETVAVERARVLLKVLRAGARDEYAVANGRIGLVYERIALAMTDASAAANAGGYEADWKDQQALIEEQGRAYFSRCARLCGTGGAHLDAWDLRCQRGLAPDGGQSPRQPE
jgi:hypothetical protein